MLFKDFLLVIYLPMHHLFSDILTHPKLVYLPK